MDDWFEKRQVAMIMKIVKNVYQACGFFLVMISSCMIAVAVDAEFTEYKDCELIREDWNDGDSFHVKLADGTKKVFRLYGVDCVETSDKEVYMKQRLDAQAYYFGVYRNDDADRRYKRLKQEGDKGTQEMKNLLSKPFTVITQNRNARGKFGNRSYAYVLTNDGAALGKLLVRAGLARVYGFNDDLPDVDEGSYRIELYDLEMTAIGERNGIWRLTEWRDLAKERIEYRKLTGKININNAKDDAASIVLITERSGVKESDVKSLLAERPDGGYKNGKDFMRVKGIGEITAKKLAAVLKFK
ncbi:MAG: endonuclease YncB(thermonuclease family) [Rubritalea sp.]|jgi:endonuclease YncB( thermonuclease family)